MCWICKKFDILKNTDLYAPKKQENLFEKNINVRDSGAFKWVPDPGADPGGAPPDPRFWGPKIEHFWALFNFSLFFFASLRSAYFSLIYCFFKVQIQKFSSLASLGISFLT